MKIYLYQNHPSNNNELKVIIDIKNIDRNQKLVVLLYDPAFFIVKNKPKNIHYAGDEIRRIEESLYIYQPKKIYINNQNLLINTITSTKLNELHHLNKNDVIKIQWDFKVMEMQVKQNFVNKNTMPYTKEEQTYNLMFNAHKYYILTIFQQKIVLETQCIYLQ